METPYIPTPRRVAGYMFNSIRTRCGNPKYRAYINVKCEITRNEFEQFIKENWSTYMRLHKTWKKHNFARPYSPSIDRIDPKLHYTRDNIQIITVSQNMSRANKGHYKKTLEYRGQSKPIAVWAQEFGVNYPTLRMRLAYGYTAEQALTKPHGTHIRKNHPYLKRTHCINGHEFSGRNLIRDAGNWRQCRICKNSRLREYRAQKKLALLTHDHYKTAHEGRITNNHPTL